jgi:hypothetical protein
MTVNNEDLEMLIKADSENGAILEMQYARS